MKGYALSYYTNYAKTLTVLGMAKDGHIIVGPYDNDGNEYSCKNLDACWGTYLSDGSYAYIFNEKFPYGVNCFGAGGYNTYEATCSTNTCSSTSSSISEFLKANIFLAMVIFSIMINMA